MSNNTTTTSTPAVEDDTMTTTTTTPFEPEKTIVITSFDTLHTGERFWMRVPRFTATSSSDMGAVTEDDVWLDTVTIAGFVYSHFGSSGGGGEVLVEYRRGTTIRLMPYGAFKKRLYTKRVSEEVEPKSAWNLWG